MPVCVSESVAGLSNRACSVGFASCETLGKHYHASLRLRSFGSARPCADSVRPLSCILARRACSVGFASVPRQPFGLPHLCIDSHLCRCIVQRLCVAVFMHPCIPTLFDYLYASLHRAFWDTRPASVPGLNVGLPPSPRLGQRPKPIF